MKKNNLGLSIKSRYTCTPFFFPDTDDPKKIRMSNTKSAKMLSLFLL